MSGLRTSAGEEDLSGCSLRTSVIQESFSSARQKHRQRIVREERVRVVQEHDLRDLLGRDYVIDIVKEIARVYNDDLAEMLRQEWDHAVRV